MLVFFSFFILIKIKKNEIRFQKKVGDQVAADEVVMEIETDKTTVGVPAPSHGVIEEIYVQDGDTVKAHQNLFKLNITGEAPKKAAAESAPAPPTSPAPKPVAAAKPAPPPSVSANTPPPPPPPRPTAPVSSIPVAAIRHAQSIESATVKVRIIEKC